MTRQFSLFAATALAMAFVSGTPCVAGEPVGCTQINVPVTIEAGGGLVAGTLCMPPGATRVQVLLPGLTYDRTYWDFSSPDDSYSYVRHETRRGEGTLALDRLGTGRSWHPPSAALTYTAQVSAIRQVIAAVHAGRVTGSSLGSVILVGHSYGAYIAFGAFGSGAVVDAVIATGATHSPLDYAALAASPVLTMPATLDPRLAGHLGAADLGYMTTWPGARAMFYANADPDIVAANEARKDTAGYLEASTASPELIERASRAIDLPVLTMVGSADFTSCTGDDCASDMTLTAAEQPHFGTHAHLHATVIPGAGHNLTLERSHRATWSAIDDFLGAIPDHGFR
ncbi:alpha/beta hydrolase [Nocardia terpenica]|uniref:AB hydrolase-1 domain-containing protein n=1 Tax=Nocardia terpenica TaxID=455432 RepID=A0A291RQY8_9NOCA|nr:alpha/beta hydrolase [Nocardia terpenica]ATL70031.1 hypothetical protein CRH09_31455 [Nocardia terpenica]